MDFLSAYAARLVVIAAISSVCEHFLRPGRAEKGMQILTGLMAVYVIADAFAAMLGR